VTTTMLLGGGGAEQKKCKRVWARKSASPVRAEAIPLCSVVPPPVSRSSPYHRRGLSAVGRPSDCQPCRQTFSDTPSSSPLCPHKLGMTWVTATCPASDPCELLVLCSLWSSGSRNVVLIRSARRNYISGRRHLFLVKGGSMHAYSLRARKRGPTGEHSEWDPNSSRSTSVSSRHTLSLRHTLNSFFLDDELEDRRVLVPPRAGARAPRESPRPLADSFRDTTLV
jgi:hypothetical protein